MPDASIRLPGRETQRGAMLIIALGVLTLLAVLGATFAQLMRLEKKASDNYVDAQRIDFVTSSALDRMIAKLHDASNHYSWTYYGGTDWLFKLNDEDDLAHGRAAVDDPRVGAWEPYMQVGANFYRFKTKVIDTNAQINLNGRQDTLAMILDNLGEAIDRSPRLDRDGVDVTNPFYTGPRRSGNRVRGEEIVLFRQRLEGQRFESKTQLRELIGEENYEVVKDFVTCHSWEDPYTYRPDDGESRVRDLFLGSAAAAGAGGAGNLGFISHQPAVGAPRMSSEPRHPINVNTAPEEVLIACLMGLAGRRIFPYSQIGAGGGAVVPADQNATITGQRVVASEETGIVTPRPVFVYTPRLEYGHARSIAERMIAERKNGRRFFRAWRTNDPSQPGFEDFVNGLDPGFFPNPTSALIIDPEQPNTYRQLQSQITGGASIVARRWLRGTAQGSAAGILRNLGLPVHQSHAWYYEAIKGVLKGNFNPNSRTSRYNPNAPAYNPVDKSDLVWADPASGQVPRLFRGHTTEFCFDSMGIFEITSLAETIDLARLEEEDVEVARRIRHGENVEARAKGSPFPKHSYQRTVRTIVKVFDVMRHTSQFHFEQNFNASARSSRQDRKFVQTWPDPMNALTELYSHGSMRDGRVELAGLNDGQRQRADINAREQLFGREPAILVQHSFSERDPQNLAELRRATRTGGFSLAVRAVGPTGERVTSDALTEALQGVFNLNFSRYQRRFREYYKRSDLLASNLLKPVFGASSQRIPYDPVVNKESDGTDLLPDGFNTSILRMHHAFNRVLVFPARGHLLFPELGTSSGVHVGATPNTYGQNIRGNVPYYQGGLAFWVKFEFDGDDPVFSGLLGCTQVMREVGFNASDFQSSEGTQFYIFKNLSGELRIVRMYYHQAFAHGGGEDAAGAATSIIPLVTEQDRKSVVLDTQKLVARSDIVVDVRHFKAHEWHHIAVDWDDRNPVQPLRVYIDFQERQEARPFFTQEVPPGGEPNSWVALNERQPTDRLELGGFVREQAWPDVGILKWMTNTMQVGAGGGVILSAPSTKRVIANATIDEFVVYEGSFPQVRQYYGGLSGAGYFTPQTGEYANIFEIPLPPEIDHIVLRSFDWTSYNPTTFTDSRANSQPVPVRSSPIDCEVWYRTLASLPPAFQEPWRRPSVPSEVSGRRIYRGETGVRGRNAEFVYKFRLRGANSQFGDTTGGIVQTPAIDDVTLTYYLPSPRVLLQEDVD